MNYSDLKIPFNKYTSCGNDFIIIESKYIPYINNELIKKICHRHYGIGSDGFIIVKENNRTFEMKYFNNDGKEANQCLNGVRATGKYIFDHHDIVTTKIQLQTKNGIVHIEKISESEYATYLEPAQLIYENMNLDQEIYSGGYLYDAGVLHYILPTNDLENVFKYAHNISQNKWLESPTNVVFVSLPLKKQVVNVRVYEKGVNAETLSCGTACIALFQWYKRYHENISTLTIHFIVSDEQMTVSQIQNQIVLNGSTEHICNGTYTYQSKNIKTNLVKACLSEQSML